MSETGRARVSSIITCRIVRHLYYGDVDAQSTDTQHRLMRHQPLEHLPHRNTLLVDANRARARTAISATIQCHHLISAETATPRTPRILPWYLVVGRRRLRPSSSSGGCSKSYYETDARSVC